MAPNFGDRKVLGKNVVVRKMNEASTTAFGYFLMDADKGVISRSPKSPSCSEQLHSIATKTAACTMFADEILHTGLSTFDISAISIRFYLKKLHMNKCLCVYLPLGLARTLRSLPEHVNRLSLHVTNVIALHNFTPRCVGRALGTGLMRLATEICIDVATTFRGFIAFVEQEERSCSPSYSDRPPKKCIPCRRTKVTEVCKSSTKVRYLWTFGDISRNAGNSRGRSQSENDYSKEDYRMEVHPVKYQGQKGRLAVGLPKKSAAEVLRLPVVSFLEAVLYAVFACKCDPTRDQMHDEH